MRPMERVTTGFLQTDPPVAPPPLEPPIKGPAFDPRPAQSVDHTQLHENINATEFKPTTRFHLGDHPQPPPEAIPAGVEKDSSRTAEPAQALIGLESDAQRSAVAAQLQATGWAVQGFEDFEGPFGNGVSCGFGAEDWSLEDYGPDNKDRTWGKDDSRKWFGRWSAWPAAGGVDALDPAQQYYSDNLDSWMICGPFDFSKAADIFVDFGLWLDSELHFDWFYFGASLDDSTYDVYYWSGFSDGWLYEPFLLSAYAGHSRVWLAWIFSSDFSNPVSYEGAWVDEITIWTYEPPSVEDGNVVENGSFEDGGEPWLAFSNTPQLQTDALDDAPIERNGIDDHSLRNRNHARAPSDTYLTDTTAVHGDWSAVMYADGELNDFLWQSVTIPMTTTDVQFGFWYAVTTEEPKQRTDWFCASLTDESFSTLIVDLGCLDATFTTGAWQEVIYTFTDEEVQDAVAAGTVNFVFELYNRGPIATGTAGWIDYVRLYASGAGTAIDHNEPNDDPNAATNIICGDTAQGTIGDAMVGYGDVDWFALRGVAPGRLDIDINARSQSPPSALDAVVYLYDSDQTTLLEWNDDDGETYDSYVVYTNTLPNASFFIAVVSYDGYGGPDSFYDMQISCADGGSGPPPAPETPAGPPDTWTLMLYLNAEDRNFESVLQQYIDDMEGVVNGKTDFLNVTVLYDGPDHGDTVRYLLQPTGIYTNGVNQWPLNEQNMGNPDTLAHFTAWSMDNYPADNYYLAIDDHGHGVYGISWDQTNNNDNLTPPEVYSALKDATNNGARKIGILDYEACLMGLAENAYDVREWVDFVVFSEQISWGLDTYPRYFRDLRGDLSARAAGIRIVNRYHAVADAAGYPHTISLINTRQMGGVKQAATRLGDALTATGARNWVNNKRSNAQAFAASLDATNADVADYVDLWDLADKTAGLPGVASAAAQVKTAVENAVVLEHHSSGQVEGYSWDHSGAHGLAIYYPASNASAVFNDYVAPRLFKMSVDDSVGAGRWDEFLAWAVTTGGNGSPTSIGGDNRKGMNSWRFLQPKQGGMRSIYVPLTLSNWPPIPDTPVLNPISNPDGDGNYTVSWGSANLANRYLLQVASNSGFDNPSTAYQGAGTSHNVNNQSGGTYYYRVQARNAWGDSPWSNVRSVIVVKPLYNGSFENGRDGSWIEVSQHGWPLIVNDLPGSVTPHNGSWAVWLGGEYDEISAIVQDVTIQSGAATLSYWLWIASQDSCGFDYGGVIIDNTIVDAFNLCTATNTGGWVRRTVNLSPYVGQTVALQIRAETDGSLNSNLFVDDVALGSSLLSQEEPPDTTHRPMVPNDPANANPRR